MYLGSNHWTSRAVIGSRTPPYCVPYRLKSISPSPKYAQTPVFPSFIRLLFSLRAGSAHYLFILFRFYKKTLLLILLWLKIIDSIRDCSKMAATWQPLEEGFKEICGLLELQMSPTSDKSQIWQQLQHYSLIPDFNNYLAFIFARAEVSLFHSLIHVLNCFSLYGLVLLLFAHYLEFYWALLGFMLWWDYQLYGQSYFCNWTQLIPAIASSFSSSWLYQMIYSLFYRWFFLGDACNWLSFLLTLSCYESDAIIIPLLNLCAGNLNNENSVWMVFTKP